MALETNLQLYNEWDWIAKQAVTHECVWLRGQDNNTVHCRRHVIRHSDDVQIAWIIGVLQRKEYISCLILSHGWSPNVFAQIHIPNWMPAFKKPNPCHMCSSVQYDLDLDYCSLYIVY